MKSNEDDLKNTRRDYNRQILLEDHAAADPWKQFAAWLEDARNENIVDYNAFNLATIDDHGFPQVRVVLLRDTGSNSLTFFTNYNSDKGKQLNATNKVCANFYWSQMERQVRIVGIVEKVKPADSDAYFASRPRESQLAAWASVQSAVIRNREELEANLAKYDKEFEGKEVPRPENWGGYRIMPRLFEFWQGRPYRLHDRIVYRLDADFAWFMERLSP
ncbi:MAG: pyridoxamine 5'-phosphate oxidase [Flavobacteriales bacterium]|nr:pyridoxamine 5'-phosphate oxidase [Flavobacteriales bacterium]